MSPRKKKPKLTPETQHSKRGNDYEETNNKRRKTTPSHKPDIAALKRKNFVKACEQCWDKYEPSETFGYYRRPLSVYAEVLLILIIIITLLRSMGSVADSAKRAMGVLCEEIFECGGDNVKIKQIPSHAEESFKIEMKTNMWSDALEVCSLCITPTQYLSSNMLKDIIEIMLNAHEEDSGEYPISNLINQCQQILALNFSTHPPCLTKSIRKCYNNFLTTAMDLKENTFTNRSKFECEKGIVKHCMNRLEYEISGDSKIGPLVDKNENIPVEMRLSVKGLHWQKEKLEIFEVLERSDRIERLMAVLFSVVELLQFDLAIWHSRYTNNLGSHIMRSHKPLMAYVLWANNVLYTGAVNNNCRQILRIFTYLIHLNYPGDYIRTMQLWLNTMIQTFYICENNSNSDYPNTGKYCMAFANEFYKIISDIPHQSKIRIFEKIQPYFMQHLIGIIHIKSILSTQEDNIIAILINFLNNSVWEQFPRSNCDIAINKPFNIRNIKPNKFLKYLSNRCQESRQGVKVNIMYPKYVKCETYGVVDQNHLVHALYITFQAYLHAYNVQDVQETLDMLNEQLGSTECVETVETISYTVSENFIKTYRNMYQVLKELIIVLNKYREEGQLPHVLKVFQNILLLGL